MASADAPVAASGNAPPAAAPDAPAAPIASEGEQEIAVTSGLKLAKLTSATSLAHSLLAVLSLPDGAAGDAARSDPMQMIGANALGFVYVSDVDTTRDRLSLLVPFPGRLPKKTLAVGAGKGVKWFELS